MGINKHCCYYNFKRAIIEILHINAIQIKNPSRLKNGK
jgi:hypothetical protein